MTIKELILELAKHPLDKEITIHQCCYEYTHGEYNVGGVYETEQYVYLSPNLFEKKGDYLYD